MSYETLQVRHEDGIDILTLHRPGVLNAFNSTMAEELEDYFRGVNHRDDVRAVVVTGEGRAFCAGVDLSSGLEKFADPDKADTTLAELDHIEQLSADAGLSVFCQLDMRDSGVCQLADDIINRQGLIGTTVANSPGLGCNDRA